MRSAYGSKWRTPYSSSSVRLAIHPDPAAMQITYWRSGVAVATSSTHRLERVIDQISGDLLTHVIAHFQ